MSTENIFIFTEIVHCGLIGRLGVQTFHKFHDRKLHIYGRREDFLHIENHPNNIFHELDEYPEILDAFQGGHRGTSKVWTKAILEAREKYLIHIDSDVIFRGDAVEEVVQKLGEYDIVGSMRNYANNPHKNRDDVRFLPDVTATYCFGFNKELIGVRESHLLERLVENSLDPEINAELRFRYEWYNYVPTLDYFDPVAFIILHNGGKVHILNNDIMGGFDNDGGKKNKYGELNKDFDFGDKIVHFASVGSGLNFVNKIEKGINIDVPQWYIDYAVAKLDLYLRLFYDRNILPREKNKFLYIEEAMRKEFAGLV